MTFRTPAALLCRNALSPSTAASLVPETAGGSLWLSGPRTACVVHEPVVAGIAAGIVGALLTSRLVQALPFGVRPTDLITVTAVVIAIGVVATAACAWPILRAVEAARESACRGARGAKPSD